MYEFDPVHRSSNYVLFIPCYSKLLTEGFCHMPHPKVTCPTWNKFDSSLPGLIDLCWIPPERHPLMTQDRAMGEKIMSDSIFTEIHRYP